MSADAIEIRAINKAEDLGHKVDTDPPAAFTAARRWTCTKCGDSVLAYGSNIYGSAVDRYCGAAEDSND